MEVKNRAGQLYIKRHPASLPAQPDAVTALRARPFHAKDSRFSYERTAKLFPCIFYLYLYYFAFISSIRYIF